MALCRRGTTARCDKSSHRSRVDGCHTSSSQCRQRQHADSTARVQTTLNQSILCSSQLHRYRALSQSRNLHTHFIIFKRSKYFPFDTSFRPSRLYLILFCLSCSCNSEYSTCRSSCSLDFYHTSAFIYKCILRYLYDNFTRPSVCR